MAKLEKVLGATSEIWQIFIQDSSSTTGAGLPSLVFNSGSLTAYYHRDTDTTATAISLVTMTVGTFTSSGFKEIDGTNMPGWYQFCPPNAALASGAKSCAFHIKGATNMAPLAIEVQLTAVNPDSGTAFLTTIPGIAGVTFPATVAAEAQGVKKNTALAAFPFPVYNSNDHKTPQTGLTVTATRSLDGAAFASCANAVTEIGSSGFYKVDLAATDLNGETVALLFTPSTGGDIRALTIRTVA